MAYPFANEGETMNTIDKILLGLVGFLIGFTITIIILFCIFQNVPDTLVECVFSLAGGEGIITFAIWWIKKKYGREKKDESKVDKP